MKLRIPLSLHFVLSAMNPRLMCRALRLRPTAPVYPGQLPVGQSSPFVVVEPCGDGSEIIRCFTDEDLAMQCAVRSGLRMEKIE
jgi:hypothetical protein